MVDSVLVPKVLNKHKMQPGEEGVYIGRPGKWGNPFAMKNESLRQDVCEKFEKFIEDNPSFKEVIKQELKGKNLVCFCAPLRCHGDTLLRIANE